MNSSPPLQQKEQGATHVVALDVGEKRVGVAAANSIARIARPLTTLARDELFWDKLKKMVAAEGVDMIVIGLPRNLNGQETAQTAAVREFGKQLSQSVDAEIAWQDETLSSVRAEEELIARKKPYAKGDVDALAATLILEDYLNKFTF